MLRITAYDLFTNEQLGTATVDGLGNATTIVNGNAAPGLTGPFRKAAERTALDIVNDKARYPDIDAAPSPRAVSLLEVARGFPDYLGRIVFKKTDS